MPTEKPTPEPEETPVPTESPTPEPEEQSIKSPVIELSTAERSSDLTVEILPSCQTVKLSNIVSMMEIGWNIPKK